MRTLSFTSDFAVLPQNMLKNPGLVSCDDDFGEFVVTFEGCFCSHSLVEFSVSHHEPFHHFGTQLTHAKVSSKMVWIIPLPLQSLFAVTSIVEQWSLQTNSRTFSMLHSVEKVQRLPDLGSATTPSCRPQVSCAIQKVLSRTGRISINIMQHCQSLSCSFSKFDTKFDIDS